MEGLDLKSILNLKQPPFRWHIFSRPKVVAVVLVMVVIVLSPQAKLIFLLEDSHVLRRLHCKKVVPPGARRGHVSHWCL